MRKTKSVGSAWSDVKAEVTKLDMRQLINLVADLYSFSKDNKTFLNTRFAVVLDPLEPYKKVISECMYPDMYSKKRVQISKAKKAISDYSKAVDVSLGVAELMTHFVEQGNAFTVNYGDIDEEFYVALIEMYRRAIERVCSLPEEQRNAFQGRLSIIMTSSANIGLGYHDALRDDYNNAFPETGNHRIISSAEA